MQIYLFLFILLACLIGTSASALELVSIEQQHIRLCPSADKRPTFDESDCQTVNLGQVDPQDKALWVKTKIEVPTDLLENHNVFALFVFGKMSSRLWFNGQEIGHNGLPAEQAKDELVGRMDTRFFVPKALIRKGENELILHISSHHGLLQLSYPVHFIGLGEFSEISQFYQHNLWFSLPLFGVLLSGAVYFLALSFFKERPKNTSLFLLMCLFASAQLLAEMSRGLFDYLYPFHDVRLISIVCCAFGFGICLLKYAVVKFAHKHHIFLQLVGLSMMLLAVILLPGFDGKTVVVIFIPALIALILLCIKFYQRPSRATLIYLLVFAGFVLTVLLTLSRFHNLPFYYVVTAMLAYLFVRQASELATEKTRRKEEERQVEKLLFKLEQNRQHVSPPKLKVVSAGKVEMIATDKITYCKAAGDYVEIYLEDKYCHLYSGSLKLLESLLPSTFLKVHRSYLVNLDKVTSIRSSVIINKEHNQSGAVLYLVGDEKVPVSRRILPLVRGKVEIS